MSRWQAALRLVGVGWYVGVCIVGGVFGGYWLDKRLDTSLFWIVGLILGIIVAFYGVYRMLLPFIAKKGSQEKS